MSNLKNMIRWEFLLMYRYKIIHISILSVILYYITTRVVEDLQTVTSVNATALPGITEVSPMSSTMLFFDPALIGIMFLGALVLFEKSERVLQALVLTPMDTNDYLFSKIISLTTLSIISSLIFMALLVFIDGAKINIFYLLGGIILASVMLILVGFIFVARVNSINGYLLSIMIGLLLLALPPVFQLFGFIDTPIIYIWPTQASFILLDGVFNSASLEAWEVAYGILYQLAWIVVLFYFSKKSFHKYIVLKGG